MSSILSIENNVKAILTGDADFIGMLPGGFYWDAVISEISRQATPAAFDANMEILPCAICKTAVSPSTGPHPHNQVLTMDFYFYQRTGHATIRAAAERVYALLHRQKALGVWDVRQTNELLGLTDPYLNSSMVVSTFTAEVNRQPS